jgi:hypothetical protein
MAAELSREDVAHIARLEEGLWHAETRTSPAWMERVLAVDFHEIGASGAVHVRAEVIAPHDGPIRSRPLMDFRAQLIGDHLALARYRSATENDDGSLRVAERASIWRKEGSGWRLVFHQGTLAPAERASS